MIRKCMKGAKTTVLGSPKFACRKLCRVTNSLQLKYYKNAVGELPQRKIQAWSGWKPANTIFSACLCNAYDLWFGNETSRHNTAARWWLQRFAAHIFTFWASQGNCSTISMDGKLRTLRTVMVEIMQAVQYYITDDWLRGAIYIYMNLKQ